MPHPATTAAPLKGRSMDSTQKAKIGPSIQIKGELLGKEDLVIEGHVEGVVRQTGRFSGPKDIASTFEGDSEWRMNRNNMRLSTAQHVRALHRRRTVSEGRASGVAHYRLDVPRDRLKDLAQHGRIARNLWTVRTLTDWERLFNELNAVRVSGAGFDTLGLHHGDYTYITPVPPIYLEQAIRHGRRLRRRWLGRKSGAKGGS